MSIYSLSLYILDTFYELKEHYLAIKNEPITAEHYRTIIKEEGPESASF
ncbi:MAG: hypothetical protein KAI18_00405 [Candidatus Aenigmarchaeota archaeon]|nr:hypothetical protein [Candidatus Aenigmarchaeota archaeon]